MLALRICADQAYLSMQEHMIRFEIVNKSACNKNMIRQLEE